MNAAQRFIVRLAAHLAPPLGKVLASAGGTVDRLTSDIQIYRERLSDEQSSLVRQAAEMAEACSMAGAGPWRPTMSESGRLSEAVRLREGANGLAELELALEDRGWKRQLAISQMEFSRYGIQQIILISRLYFIKNPLVRRGVQVSSHYVFGRGLEVGSDDATANKVLHAFFTDPRNVCEIGHRALVEKEEALHTDGNLFFALFSSPDDGATVIRTIDATEIQEIISNPDDSAEPWYYRRTWMRQIFDDATGNTNPVQSELWYVALGHETKLRKIRDIDVAVDPVTKRPIPVLHHKVGGLPKWQFGCPLVYSWIDWARAYKQFLENWATIQQALARFAWQVETQGGQPAIAAFKQTLATTLGNDGQSVEINPPPTVGSAFISGPGNKMTPVKTAGTQTNPEAGRRIMLMVAAAAGLPETFFGDASTGSLATAQSLDRPTELKFLEAQERWRGLLQCIGQYVLEQSARAPQGRLKEAKKEAEPITVEVTFPAVLEHDITQRVAAITNAMTLSGFETSGIDEKVGVGLLLKELGVEDPDTVLEEMYPEADYNANRKAQEEADAQAAADAAAAAGGNTGETSLSQNPAKQKGAPPGAKRPASRVNPKTGQKESLNLAVAELRRAAARFVEHGNGHA